MRSRIRQLTLIAVIGGGGYAAEVAPPGAVELTAYEEVERNWDFAGADAGDADPALPPDGDPSALTLAHPGAGGGRGEV